MRHGFNIASAAALVIAASCATASATEENTPPPRPLAPRSSVQLQPVPNPQASETTGALSTAKGSTEAAKVVVLPPEKWSDLNYVF